MPSPPLLDEESVASKSTNCDTTVWWVCTQVPALLGQYNKQNVTKLTNYVQVERRMELTSYATVWPKKRNMFTGTLFNIVTVMSSSVRVFSVFKQFPFVWTLEWAIFLWVIPFWPLTYDFGSTKLTSLIVFPSLVWPWSVTSLWGFSYVWMRLTDWTELHQSIFLVSHINVPAIFSL